MRQLKNHYFILRHGHSQANAAGIIVSHADSGKLDDFSLTPEGERQVRESVLQAQASGWLNNDTVIISSPFSRCRRSAEIVKEVLGVQTFSFDDRLRERWFGNWEGQSDKNYEKVWELDKLDPNHTIELVESAQDVQVRVSSVIEDLEKIYSGKIILLVSHGDALQILQTWFQEESATQHRELAHIKTAEIRKLN